MVGAVDGFNFHGEQLSRFASHDVDHTESPFGKLANYLKVGDRFAWRQLKRDGGPESPRWTGHLVGMSISIALKKSLARFSPRTNAATILVRRGVGTVVMNPNLQFQSDILVQCLEPIATI
jgi:hypothetical protein